jgi:hypothetical protein
VVPVHCLGDCRIFAEPPRDRIEHRLGDVMVARLDGRERVAGQAIVGVAAVRPRPAAHVRRPRALVYSTSGPIELQTGAAWFRRLPTTGGRRSSAGLLALDAGGGVLSGKDADLAKTAKREARIFTDPSIRK